MATCRSCGQRITPARTRAGWRIAVDEDPVADGNILLDVLNCQLVASIFGSARAAAQAAPEEPRYVIHHCTVARAGEWRGHELD